jgi:hypothetical protein
MDSLQNLVARGSTLLARDNSPQMSSTVTGLLIALLVLVIVLLCLTAAIITLRKVRSRKAIARQQLPLYSEKRSSSSSSRSHQRRLTISTSPPRGSSIYVYDEKAALGSPTTPTSPVPEIRITFPDEQDESGRRKSGRVLLVRVGETGVGLEPMRDEEDEQLPAYEKESKGRFQSIDIERIGGLKEKSTWS